MSATTSLGYTSRFKIGWIIIAPFYYGVAAACVLGLLLTMRGFFAVERQILHRVP
jgi:hypothetical protein